MMLDIDYIEQILKTVEAHPKSQMMQSDLMEAIKADSENEEHIDKFYYHMKRIEEAGFLTCMHVGRDFNDGFGFIFHNTGMSLLDMEYELTLSGCEFLDAMRNDTMKSKITSWFKDMTLEQIKTQTPVLLTRLISGGNLL